MATPLALVTVAAGALAWMMRGGTLPPPPTPTAGPSPHLKRLVFLPIKLYSGGTPLARGCGCSGLVSSITEEQHP